MYWQRYSAVFYPSGELRRHRSRYKYILLWPYDITLLVKLWNIECERFVGEWEMRTEKTAGGWGSRASFLSPSAVSLLHQEARVQTVQLPVLVRRKKLL